jgi:hypothetical protein
MLRLLSFIIACTILSLDAAPLTPPKIKCIETFKDAAQSATLFIDDFEDNIPLKQKYTEYISADNSCTITDSVGFGGSKFCNKATWKQGQVDAGGLTIMFGKNPVSSKVNTSAIYNEIYWRHYVMTGNGWNGSPYKLSRATILASSAWAQPMIAHVWSNTTGNTLMLDPATGIQDGILATTKYNDFENLKWLGQKPAQTPIYSPQNAGIWFCIEARVKLNSPGKTDGIFELWIDNTLEASTLQP